MADSVSSAAEHAMRQSMLSNARINNDLNSYLQVCLHMLRNDCRTNHEGSHPDEHATMAQRARRPGMEHEKTSVSRPMLGGFLREMAQQGTRGRRQKNTRLLLPTRTRMSRDSESQWRHRFEKVEKCQRLLGRAASYPRTRDARARRWNQTKRGARAPFGPATSPRSILVRGNV